MKKTLFLNPPSFEGFDGGAGARYQMRREVRSFWYPTWLAQPAAMVPGSRLVDAPPDNLSVDDVLTIARGYELAVIHTSTPSLRKDAAVAAALKAQDPDLLIGFVGAQAAVQPEVTLRASEAIDFVAGREYDYTILDIAEGRDLKAVAGISYREDGRIVNNQDRPLIEHMDDLPSVIPVYKRDLTVENYYNGYLQHPYLSLYTGRGCPAKCTFCLWPQTIGGHVYRVKSPEAVYEEIRLAKSLFPQVKEFFFDDDTFTANWPRARAIARRIKTLGVDWSCNCRANLDYETMKILKDCGLRLFLVGYESGNQQILNNIKKGLMVETAREFTRNCKKLGILIHGTFILGLPVETPETIEETIRFACEINPDTIQVSLAAAYPGTELYKQAKQNGWFVSDSLVNDRGIQSAVLQYPGISHEEISEALERFYRRFYFRPTPILRIVKEMLKDRKVFQRRIREGAEFFRFLGQRKALLKPQPAPAVN